MRLVLVFLLTILSLNSFGQTKLDCDKVKTGKFKLSNEISGTTIIKRTKNYQIETNEKYDYKATFKIVWIDSCTYELSERKFSKGPDILKGNSGDIIQVKILWIKDNIMKVRSTSNFSDLSHEVEIEIL